ncbi:MAG: family 10 glycosylhydrolase [Bacteroidales bacterium]|nr:family 10 glycosylhydrolase [Bacteroidales bacterium]
MCRKLSLLLLCLPLLLSTSWAQSESLTPQNDEFRGVWLATVAGLDWPDCNELAIVQQLRLIEQIKGLRELGCNTLIFQVVSNMDALYPSRLLPWSAVLTGKEGQDPYYDPLALAVQVAHDCGMQIHAWINPLRVCRDDITPHDSSHVSISHPEWVQNYRHKLYLDPGNPEVVEFLRSIAKEIVENYAIDGLHIDDYFYPDGLQKDGNGWRNDMFELYGKGKALDEWRFGTINNVVRVLYETTHECKPDLVFGVSPSGRLVNTCRLYADPRMWVDEGTVDYLAPQIYWAIGRGDAAAFEQVLDSWSFVSKGVPVYVGLAAYKYAQEINKGLDAPYLSLAEFKRELELCRKSWYVKGHIWFRTLDVLRDDFRSYILSELYEQ